MTKLKQYLRSLCKSLVLCAIGGGAYYLVELIWRGSSHFSMILVGGMCFLCIGQLNHSYLEWEMPLTSQMFLSGGIITVIEFAAGLLLNVKLGLGIWDYSDIPYNFMGQICLSYFALWQFLSIVGILLDDYIRYWFFGEDKPRYTLI